MNILHNIILNEILDGMLQNIFFKKSSHLTHMRRATLNFRWVWYHNTSDLLFKLLLLLTYKTL